MVENRLHVVMVESQSGFPYAGAAASRLRMLSLAIREAGAQVSVVLLKPGEPLSGSGEHEREGEYRGVHYYYAAGTAVRSGRFVTRRWHAFIAAWWLARYVHRCARTRPAKRHALYLSSDAPSWTAITALLAKVFGFPLVIELCEWQPAVPGCSRLQSACNSLRLSWADGVFAISQYLQQRVAARWPSTPVLRVPILVDCDEWWPRAETGPAYVLWCGQIDAYRESVLWLVKAFASIAHEYPDSRFVIAGKCDDASRIAILATSAAAGIDAGRIDLRGYVPQSELARLYGGARALLAPLENDERSLARFPTKIGEYLASGRPVIACAVGDSCRYLHDGVSALIAAPGDIAGYSKRMADVLEQPDLADRIGDEGRDVARRRFHYSQHGLRMALFVDALCQRGAYACALPR